MSARVSAPDHEFESRTFAALAQQLARSPADALQRVAESGRVLCRADSVAINRIEGTGDAATLRWHAIAGAIATRVGSSTTLSPPFAHAASRNELTLAAHGDAHFASVQALDPEIRQALILPWTVGDVPAGAVCLMTRDADRHFDGEDARILGAVASYASMAWQLLTARNEVAQAQESEGDARLRKLFGQAPGFMAILQGPDHVFEFCNHAYTRLVGSRDLLGRRVRDVFPEVAGQGFFEWLDNVYRTGTAHIGYETPLRLQSSPEGPPEELYVDFIYQAITDEAGHTTGIFVEGNDVSARVRNAAELRAREAHLRTLAEGIPQLVWRSRVDGSWTWSSPQWQACTGQSLGQSCGQGWLLAIHPEDRPAVLQAWKEAVSTGLLDVEHRVQRASDGVWLWHHSRSVPIRDHVGRIVEWLGTSTDVQQLKEIQDRQTVLMGELQHRTRNLIAVVRAIVGQTLSNAASLPEFEAAFNDRMQALGRVQGLLSRVAAGRITIESLVRMELNSVGAFEGDGQEVSVSGPVVTIRQSVVQTLALALHELAVNARKHGALRARGGRVDVSWRVVNSNGKGSALALDWVEEDSGITAPPASAKAGFGRYLLERALPYLGVTTRFELGASGARCGIEIPLQKH